MKKNVLDPRPAGYDYVLHKLSLSGIPNWHRSAVTSSATYAKKSQEGPVDEVFRVQY